jgi:membrane-associated phospholipid phosphatase
MTGRPWLRALAWLALLGPCFFLSYNFANGAAARRSHVATLMFSWESHIPFVAWTIVPYWSSDVLYPISLLICRTREELDLHGKRLLAIQIFSVACFLAFPLRCAFPPPLATGWEGSLFQALRAFDRPFNQAPSLHVSLAVILWVRFRAHPAGPLRILLALWFFLVAASTLTTWQHQFIDIPTGAWAGLLVVAALPEWRSAPPQLRLTLLYLTGAVACTAAAFAWQGLGWMLLWPGFSLSMVAAAYWTGDSGWLLIHRLPMLPHTAVAWINSRLWTRGQPAKNHLRDAVWIGRAPSRHDREGMNSVVVLGPELRIRGDAHVAMLDLSPPTEQQLEAAVLAIEGLAQNRPTLVCCALGYSRSAVACAAWLIAAGHAVDVDDALRQVRMARPQVVISPLFRLSLERWAAGRI